MTNIHFVKCPHDGCDWFGILPISYERERSETTPNVAIVGFECPNCSYEWEARVIGDDVELLPVGYFEEDLQLAWPLVDLGEGD